MTWLTGQNVYHYEDFPLSYWKHWHQEEKRSLSPKGLMVNKFLQDTRKHDRGVPYTPIAFLMDKAHGWTNNALATYRIFHNLPAEKVDFAIDQHFESLSWPLRRDLMKVKNDEQAMMPQSIIGNTYDVLVTANGKANSIDPYRVVWLVGASKFDAAWKQKIQSFVQNGGTLIANVEQARGVLDEKLLGAKLSGEFKNDTKTNCSLENEVLTSSIYDYEKVTPTSAKVLVTAGNGDAIIVENKVGKGKVLLTTPRWMMTRDGWALPLQSHLALHVSSGLLPIEVRGNVDYYINKTARGWFVGLMNNRGVYKMAHAQAVVERDEVTPVEVLYKGKTHSKLVVQPGDVQLIEIKE